MKRLTFQTVHARTRRRFRLELTANDGRQMLTLSASELAIDGDDSHFMLAGSRSLQMTLHIGKPAAGRRCTTELQTAMAKITSSTWREQILDLSIQVG